MAIIRVALMKVIVVSNGCDQMDGSSEKDANRNRKRGTTIRTSSHKDEYIVVI